MEYALKKKVVLVSGEASQLSMGIIHSFLQEDAIVIYPAKSFSQMEKVKSFKDIGASKNFITLLVDVMDFEKVNETCEIVKAKFKEIDIAIEIPDLSSSKKKLTEASYEDWNNMMETDMAPFFMGARIVLNLMKGSPDGMFVHLSDGKIFENANSCALARIAFTTRLEMSKIFAEEANKNSIRYYHIWMGSKDPENPCSYEHSRNYEEISSEIKNLYFKKGYNTEEALQSFPEQVLQKM